MIVPIYGILSARGARTLTIAPFILLCSGYRRRVTPPFVHNARTITSDLLPGLDLRPKIYSVQSLDGTRTKERSPMAVPLR